MDKRTKKYKEWKANQEKASEGLGDSVAKVTKATGVDKAVKFVLGEDCGCDARRKKLNQIFPYKKPECLTEIEYNYLTSFFELKTKHITSSIQKELFKIYNRVFHQNKPTGNCPKCVAEVVRELKNYLNFYQKSDEKSDKK